MNNILFFEPKNTTQINQTPDPVLIIIMFRALTKLVPRRTAYPVRWFGNEPKVEGN